MNAIYNNRMKKPRNEFEKNIDAAIAFYFSNVENNSFTKI